MAGLQGNLKGVGADIVGFLTDVATHFNLTIVVTSGYRDAAAQAAAMLGNWKKLKRGMVYAKATLPEEDRKKLDQYYVDAVENPKRLQTLIGRSLALLFLRLLRTRSAPKENTPWVGLWM